MIFINDTMLHNRDNRNSITSLRTLRKDHLSGEERLQALWNHQKPDRVPIWGLSSSFSAINVGYSCLDFYIDAKKSADSQRWTNEQYGWDPITVSLGTYCAFAAEEFGGKVRWPNYNSAQAPVVAVNAINRDEDILNLSVPSDIDKLPSIKRILENTAYLLNWSCAVISPYLPGPMDTAEAVLGIERLCRLLIKKPSYIHHAFRIFTDFKLRIARLFANTFGTKNLVPEVGGPMQANSIISASTFKEFCLPYVKEQHEKMRDMGYKHMWFHPCGEQNANLPFWAQCNFGDPGIISVGHEINLSMVAKYFPNDICFGNIKPTIIQFENGETVYETGKKISLQGKVIPGGFIFAPGCDMPPKAPPYNVWMMTKAVNDFGWY